LAIVGVLLLSILGTLPVFADLSLSGGDAAQVAYTNGDGVMVRAEAGVDTGIVTTLPEGYAVTIDDGPFTLDDGSSWYAITTDTNEGTFSGFIHADYLAGSALVDPPSDGSSGAFSGPAIVFGTGGEGLNLRESSSLVADVVLTIPEGAMIEVLAAGVTEADGILWSEVRFDGVIGYSASDYIGAIGVGPDSTIELAAFDSSAPGDTATISGSDGAGVMVRVEPGLHASGLSAAAEGASAQVLDGPVYDADGASWYQVETIDTVGWVRGDFLSIGAAPSAPSVGDTFISRSMSYLGVPYVWGGSEPDGFDCSGFTYFIVNEVLGNDFPRAIEQQMALGVHVERDELVAGDIIFFENTYQPGLSHVGFYIGDGQFISATGRHDAVTITSLDDPYWSERYLTTRRVA
jgi:cell wall-associated NlpC family hydrolase